MTPIQSIQLSASLARLPFHRSVRMNTRPQPALGRGPVLLLLVACTLSTSSIAARDWRQLQGGPRRSGDASQAALPDRLELLAAMPLSDGVYASPVAADGMAYVLDGAGLLHAIGLSDFKTAWTFQTEGGAGNCNQVAAPAIAGEYLHVGTTAGNYYVLDRHSGAVVRKIHCGEPIFSAPAVSGDRVYLATLGARVYALSFDGEVAWTWDFVREVVKFPGNRWSGMEWLEHRGDRVTWKDHFVCSRDICVIDRTVVMPAGGRTVFLEDQGDAPRVRTVGTIPSFAGSEYPATFGQSADAAGNVYVQWHRRDNAGRVEVLTLDQDDQLEASYVRGTQTAISLPGLLSFAAVAIHDGHVLRVRPEHGLGLSAHTSDADPQTLHPVGSIVPPLVTANHILHAGLDGVVYATPAPWADDSVKAQQLPTAFGAPISAPLALAQDKVLIGGEDGYLYIYGRPGAQAAVELPTKDLEIWKIRSPLTGRWADKKYNWYTNYGDFRGANANDQQLAPPLRMRWARRLEGTVKHLPVCGGGRLYTHTAEGQIIAVEQDTGRVLWRRYWPDVYLSFTSPLYIDGKLLVPQAGIKRSLVRCLDAETGKLLWEAPFTGSPSWSRQFPPVVHEGIAIYASGSGKYAAQGSEKPFIFKGEPADHEGKEVMSWIYSNNNPYYPKDHRPRLWAWDLETGKLVWERDFSEHGRGGNDCGICLLDGKLYYSTFFGYAASQRKRRGLPDAHNGLTACLDPSTGETIWLTHKYFVTSKCTLSARDGRIYIGGYNRANEGADDRYVWCLDAQSGKLVWQSQPVTSALNVVTVGERFIFSNALRGKGNIFDRETGEVVNSIGHNYACCRFTLSEPYVLGANMDMIDLSDDGKLVSTGPAIDSRECLGAVVSNGRIFYTSQASGFVVSQTYGEEAKKVPAVWEAP